MPYPNEHAARIHDPGAFEPNSFRRVNITAGVDAIMGKMKGQSSMTIQTYRFAASKFTAAEAKKWLASHDIKPILFEAATGPANEAIRKAVR